jgi:magnesium transporter
MSDVGGGLSQTVGLPPGTLVHVGDKPAGPVKLSVIRYDEQSIVEYESTDLDACLASLQQPGVTWLNVAGLDNLGLVERLGQALGLHPLVLEDIVNTSQRPKTEDYQDYFFIVLKMLEYDQVEGDVLVEQVSLVLGDSYLVSFQEDESDVFQPLPTIYRLKREMIAVRRAVWPLREVIAGLQHSESALIRAGTVIYLRDVHDHTVQIMDTIESMRDLLSGMLDVYLSVLSNRMNEIMKVLTVFAAIFIPLTFLAGVYGMNFVYFPEMQWRLGYPLFWMASGAIALVMLLFFRRKHWL